MTPVWTIEWMQTTPTAASPSEAVLQVGWRCSGSEDTYSGTVYSTCTLPAADPRRRGAWIPLERRQPGACGDLCGTDAARAGTAGTGIGGAVQPGDDGAAGG